MKRCNRKLTHQTTCFSPRFCVALGSIIAFFSLISPVFGQLFSGDQNLPSLKWRKIEGHQFTLIYPTTFEKKAAELARELDSLYLLVNKDLQARNRKIPVVIQNQSVLSNGFVQLAPRKSEWISTPPPQSENFDWMTILAVHEMRHVAQFDRIVGKFNPPFFEQLGLALYGLNLPAWLFEGDAVRIESTVTRGGRGRTPSYLMPLRTNLLNNKLYSYQKNYLGSYRSVTPGHYELGYALSSKLEADYGAGATAILFRDIAKSLIRPYNMSKALQSMTGHNTKSWHTKTIQSLQETWKAEDERRYKADYATYPLGQDKKSGSNFPNSWLLPQPLGTAGGWLALRQGVQYAPAIMQFDAQGESPKKIVSLGWQLAPHFSASGKRLVWDEYRRNARFGMQMYNVLVTYDLATKQKRQLTYGTRLFSPALSADGAQVASIAVAEDNQCALVLLDWDTGTEIQRIDMPEGWMLQTPSFHTSGEKVVAAVISSLGNSLIEFDLSSRTYMLLFDWQAQQLESPVYWKDEVLFKAHFGEIDNIYVLKRDFPGEVSASLDDKIIGDGSVRIQQVTHVRFGAFHPAVDHTTQTLYFNNYQLGGHLVSMLSLPEYLRQEVAFNTPDYVLLLPSFKGKGERKEGSQAVVELESKPYTGWKTWFNFHSLSLSSNEFSNVMDMKPGVFLLSDNLLNTIQTRLGYVYNSEERSSEYNASLILQRWLPKFEIGYENRGRSGVTRVVNQADSSSVDHKMKWREHNIKFDASIPLTFYQFNHLYTMNFYVGTYMLQRYNLSVAPGSTAVQRNFVEEIRFPLRYAFSFRHQLRAGQLDLAPRWGQAFGLGYRHFKQEDVNKGKNNRLFTFWSTFFFPGFMPNHSTVLRFNYQQGAGLFEATNDIPLVSGYDYLAPSKVRNTFLTTYQFPIAYPDWEIGNLAYIKRIKGGFFADFQNIKPSQSSSLKPRTYGLELRANMNLFRYFLPVFDVGAKVIVDNHPQHRGKIYSGFSVGYTY